MACARCKGSGWRSNVGLRAGLQNTGQPCLNCAGVGHFVLTREEAVAQQRRREQESQDQAESALREAERQKKVLSEQAAETARLEVLLAEPERQPGVFGRLLGKRGKPFKVEDFASERDLDKRERLIRSGLERSTNTKLAEHLLKLKERLRTKGERRDALEELENLDVRAIPMLVDMYFREEHSEKTLKFAFKAMARIPDRRSLFYFACFLQNWTAHWDIGRLIRKVDQVAGGFSDLAIPDQIRCRVAWFDGNGLRSAQKDTDAVLLGDLASNIERNQKFGLFALIGLGNEAMIPKMIEILNGRDDLKLAEAYLNCGHDDLVAAADAWCRARGYDVVKGGEHAPVKWGSL